MQHNFHKSQPCTYSYIRSNSLTLGSTPPGCNRHSRDSDHVKSQLQAWEWEHVSHRHHIHRVDLAAFPTNGLGLREQHKGSPRHLRKCQERRLQELGLPWDQWVQGGLPIRWDKQGGLGMMIRRVAVSLLLNRLIQEPPRRRSGRGTSSSAARLWQRRWWRSSEAGWARRSWRLTHRASVDLAFIAVVSGNSAQRLYQVLRPKRPVNRNKGFKVPKPLPQIDAQVDGRYRGRLVNVWGIMKHF